MTTYFDTSVLVKLYVQESDSSLADAWLDRCVPKATISPLSEVELATALQAKGWRSGNLLTARRLNAAYLLFRSEVGSGKYEMAAIDSSCFGLARELGETYGGTLGVRALDVMHVAAAMRSGAQWFGTFDVRQGRLAEAVGLQLME